MGVYIKGMEMPTSCRDCSIEQKGFWCGALDHVIGYSIHCKCAEEHRQLAKWLVELRERRKAEEGE